MTPAIQKLIHDIVNREGGYVNHPEDKGGPTKYGITLGTLMRWRRRLTLTADDVKNLTVEEASQIYLNEYVVAPGFDKIKDVPLMEAVVDAAVNHGINGASRMLQEALMVSTDGILGDKTWAALAGYKESFVWMRFMAYRLRFYSQDIHHNPSQAVFAEGWLMRCVGLMKNYAAELKAANDLTNAGLMISIAIKSQAAAEKLHPLANAQHWGSQTFMNCSLDCLIAAQSMPKK